MSAGWRFSRDDSAWAPVEAEAAAPATPLTRPLRLATLNCLHDLKDADLLQHDVRYAAICDELRALDADVIGLNEVTRTLLERLLAQPWVRAHYTASAVPEDCRCAHLSAVGGTTFGNLLLSRLAPTSVAYLEQPGDGRHAHVIELHLAPAQGGAPLHVAVCSALLTACPWLMESRRKLQLAAISSALAAVTPALDVCVTMGDLNFHREAENASIPDEWVEMPAVVALGPTWHFARNAMLPHYLPLRNLYNGLGLGTQLGWPSPMRLDRVLVRGVARLDGAAAKARLFADRPIHERARGRTPLPQVGPELREAHRALPWEEYLHPSDHFGIFVELPFRPT